MPFSRIRTRDLLLLLLSLPLIFSACTEEALAGLVAGSILLYVIGAVILFILLILALVDLYRGSYPLNKKLLWLLIILIVPYIGAILYFVIGRKEGEYRV